MLIYFACYSRMPYRMSTAKFTKVREQLLLRLALAVKGGAHIALFHMHYHSYFPFHCTITPKFKEFCWSPDIQGPQGELLHECYLEGARGLESLYSNGSMCYYFIYFC